MCRRRRGDVRETQWSGIGRLMEHITGSREWSHDGMSSYILPTEFGLC